LSGPAPSDTVEGEDSDINVAKGSGHHQSNTAALPSQAQPDLIPFDLDHEDPCTNLASTDDAVSSLDAQSELLRWHYRLAHLSFANIRLMVAKGEIPKRLATCKIPKCQFWLYGRATKQAWQSKGKTHNICTVTKPGGCVSVDQLESPVPGFVVQNKGYFFWKQYKVATILIISVGCLLFTFRSQGKGRKRFLPNGLLKHTLPLLASALQTTMPTTGDLLSVCFSTMLNSMDRRYHCVVSMPIFKMGLLRREFVT
jgi:hypothetical protein